MRRKRKETRKTIQLPAKLYNRLVDLKGKEAWPTFIESIIVQEVPEPRDGDVIDLAIQSLIECKSFIVFDGISYCGRLAPNFKKIKNPKLCLACPKPISEKIAAEDSQVIYYRVCGSKEQKGKDNAIWVMCNAGRPGRTTFAMREEDCLKLSAGKPCEHIRETVSFRKNKR